MERGTCSMGFCMETLKGLWPEHHLYAQIRGSAWQFIHRMGTARHELILIINYRVLLLSLFISSSYIFMHVCILCTPTFIFLCYMLGSLCCFSTTLDNCICLKVFALVPLFCSSMASLSLLACLLNIFLCIP